MKPQINFEYGDIIIRRVSNGWVVFSGSEYEAGHVMTSVYEQGDGEWGDNESFIHLIREHFIDLVQSKKRGGIKLEVREKGYSDEEKI